MSAHGDYEDLLHFLSCQNTNLVKQIFIVHGEENVQFDFQKKLLDKGFKNVVVPQMHQEISLG
jgi:metallo-beta-lactamase family protein